MQNLLVVPEETNFIISRMLFANRTKSFKYVREEISKSMIYKTHSIVNRPGVAGAVL